MTRKLEGGCLCGAVRYVVEAEPVNERICHCRLCQKAIGASFNARILFRAEDVHMAGPIRTFNSSDELKRGFCPHCGTTIFSARDGQGLLAVTAGSLDDPSLFQPTVHIWTASAQPWLKLDDGLPQCPEAAPA